jgi:phosphoglycerol transferase MdoB-like AlkP superfamily enzyme
MNKKTNTLLFVLGATVFNVLITFISLLVLLLVYFRLIAPKLPESAAAWGVPVIFVGSIALSFVVYRIVLKQILKRVDMEKYFDPIFNARKPVKPKP